MKLPAGKYYIGDPCYVIDESKWHDFCDILFANKDDEVTEFEGHPMFASGTAYGDGCYGGSDGVGYGVDAGLLSVVPMALVVKRSLKEVKRLGSIVEFKNPFEAYCSKKGVFHFGHITINTK